MKTRKLVAAGAIAASVAGGAVGGALLFTPSLSGAQESTTTTAAPDSTAPSSEARPFKADHLESAAEAIGITVDELRTAIEGGKTIAQVAEDEGKDVDDVVAALVKAASDKLDAAVAAGTITEAQATERKADLEEHMTALVNGERPAFGGRGPGGHGFGGGAPEVEGAGLSS